MPPETRLVLAIRRRNDLAPRILKNLAYPDPKGGIRKIFCAITALRQLLMRRQIGKRCVQLLGIEQNLFDGLPLAAIGDAGSQSCAIMFDA